MADQKLTHLKYLAQNCAYFVNSLRRKQALISLKEAMVKGIEKRDGEVRVMKEKLIQTMEIVKGIEMVE
jgi:hypothetical protein